MVLLFLLCRYADETAVHHQEGRAFVFGWQNVWEDFTKSYLFNICVIPLA